MFSCYAWCFLVWIDLVCLLFACGVCLSLLLEMCYLIGLLFSAMICSFAGFCVLLTVEFV